MTTWSGQHESSAWHWTPENCQKLGNVILLLKSGTAAKREEAYQEFTEIKRNFIEEEFEEYLNRLENFQVSMGGEPLRKIMEEIQGERAPVTGVKGELTEPAAGKGLDMLKNAAALYRSNAIMMCPICGNRLSGQLLDIGKGQYSMECPYCDKNLQREPVMLPEMECSFSSAEEQEAHFTLCKAVERRKQDEDRPPKPVTVTRYDLFITLVKKGYHALEM